MPVLPFCTPAYHRIPRRSKMDSQACPCFFLNFGYNHGSDCFKIMVAETGRIAHSRSVTWHQPREPLIYPAPTVGSGLSYQSSGAETPDYVYIQSTPAATATPAAAPATAAPVPASAVTAPATAPLSNPPHVNSGSRCSGAGARGGYVHAWTLARRDARSEVLAPQHGSDVPCCIGAQVATRDVFDETFKEHRLPKLELTSRLPPPVIYRLRPPLPRRRHGSTLRYGVVPGSGSSAAYCRPTRSVQLNSHFASDTLPIDCYAGPNVWACSRPLNSRALEPRHILACSDASASATVDGVGGSLVGAFGRSALGFDSTNSLNVSP